MFYSNCAEDTELRTCPELYTRVEVFLENGISFHAYHVYTRWEDYPGFLIATVREVEDPTDQYDSLADIPDSVFDDMDYIPQFYSIRIGTSPVIVDYNGTLLIPQCYAKRLKDLSGEYKVRGVRDY